MRNILEPATFGVILTGLILINFRSKKLQQLAGLYAVSDQAEFNSECEIIDIKKFVYKSRMIAGHFINSNTRATKTDCGHLA
jgi:hypothetical protein